MPSLRNTSEADGQSQNFCYILSGVLDGILQVAFLCKSKGEPHKLAKIRKGKSPEVVWQMPFTKSLFTDIFILVYCPEYGHVAYLKGRFVVKLS